jgi:hypothetical protein
MITIMCDFLTEAGYKKVLEDQDRLFIQILNHEKVSQGHLQYGGAGGE